MIRFETLLEKVRSYSPEADLELLRRAYVFSALEHKGQVRHSGEPYLVHPLEVADSLADMKLDVVAVAATQFEPRAWHPSVSAFSGVPSHRCCHSQLTETRCLADTCAVSRPI